MKTVLAALAALLVTAVAGCSYGPNLGGPPPTQKACDVELYAPEVSNALGSIASIMAVANASCDVQPISHVIHLGIEKEADTGGWSPVQSGTDCRDLPRPDHPVHCEWHAVPCVDGHYRTTATVTGEGQNGSFAFTAPERPASLIACEQQ